LSRHPEIEIVCEKVDDGYSGILFDRPAFTEMMNEVEQGNANCIITKDLSRLGREYIETGRYLRRIFPAYGVRFIAINDNFDTLNDSSDDLSVSIRVALNDSYAHDISRKTRDALESKRRIGDYVGACPVYGYKKDEDNRNLLVIDEHPASVVRDIYQMKIDGFSAARIARILDERGILSPIEYKKHNRLPHPKGSFSDVDGGRWAVSTIFRILANETYTGTLVQGKMGTPNYKLKEMLKKPPSEWHRVENTHEAIIHNYRFDLVQKILMLDTRTSPHNDKVYLFSGILVCGHCNNRMTRRTVPNRNKTLLYYYYYCPTTKKKGCGLGASIKEQDLVFCVLHSIKAHISNIAKIENLLAELDPNRAAKILSKHLSIQLEENKQRLNKVHRFKAGLHGSMINGDIDKDELKSLKAKYTEDENALEVSIEKLQKEIEDILSCRNERIEWIKRFKIFENIEELTREAVVCLIHSIYIRGKNEIEIKFDHQEDYENALKIYRNEVCDAT